MTDRTFTFTIEQIKQIYQAGIQRGTDEQSAYDWGCSPNGKEYDECVDVIHGIINEGKYSWHNDPSYIDYKTVEEWFKEK